MSDETGRKAVWLQRVLGLDAAGAGHNGSSVSGTTANAARAPGQAKGEGSVVRLAKGMLVWNNTRSYVSQQVKTLQQAILVQSANEPDFGEIKANIGKLEALLEVLDDRLIGKLDELRGTTDTALKQKISEEARGIVAGYQSYVADNELMNDIDDNGFVQLDIKVKVSASLTALLQMI